MIYLDNHATTRTDPRVLAAMLPFFAEEYGNAASAEHAMGRRADAAVEQARGAVAALIGAAPLDIRFTSGATEANNIAILGAARAATDPTRRRIITIATEHPSVLEPVAVLGREGFDIVVLPVDGDGRPDPGRLEAALGVPTLLVSVMAANNEIGTLAELAQLAALVHAAGAFLHTDATQAVGKVPLDVVALGVDLLSLSAHKIHGPKGVGALYVRRRPRVPLLPVMTGGGQERGLRPGTLAVPLIVGLGVAAALAREEGLAEQERIARLAAGLFADLRARIPGLRLNAAGVPRLAGNLNIVFPNLPAASLMEQAPELCVSSGSACHAGGGEPSHVLRAIGLSNADAACTLRLGLGRFTSQAECDAAALALARAAEKIEASRCPI